MPDAYLLHDVRRRRASSLGHLSHRLSDAGDARRAAMASDAETRMIERSYILAQHFGWLEWIPRRLVVHDYDAPLRAPRRERVY